MEIPKPCKEEAEKYLKEWEDPKNNYVELDKCLNHVFEKYPNNDDLNSILIKTTLLNTFYGTNIRNIHTVAKHILESNIDEALSKCDEGIIDKIANVTFVDKNNTPRTMHLYSFATKYCSFHKPDYYPMYDSYLEKLLKHFRDRKYLSNFNLKDLKEYSKYKEVLKEFRQRFDLEDYSIKEIDEYLWLLGKEIFGNNK